MCFDARTYVYQFLPFNEVYKVSRQLCKSEFRRVLKLSGLIMKDRQEEQIEITLPCTHQIQRFPSAENWWGFFFQVAAKPNIKLTAESSSMLAMSLLERYAGLLHKIGIELDITGFHDCN